VFVNGALVLGGTAFMRSRHEAGARPLTATCRYGIYDGRAGENVEKLTLDDVVRRLAHQLWEGRDRPDGSDQHDWFTAQSHLNRAVDAQSTEPCEFFHCFTRSKRHEEAFATLQLMLDIGLLLTPEPLEFFGDIKVTQARLSLAFIRRQEVFRHSQEFGPFVLRMASYDVLVAKYGAAPVWYLPSYAKENDAVIFQHGRILISGLACVQHWLEEMEHDAARADQRHYPHYITRLITRLLYPTHYRSAKGLAETHFHQREWRVIRYESGSVSTFLPTNVDDNIAPLTPSEQARVLSHAPGFFGKQDLKVWSEAAHQRVQDTRINNTWKLKGRFDELVREILVPPSWVERVRQATRAAGAAVLVSSSEQYEYGHYT
jgi:hypothetical protein